jgi:hypothetical protein
MTSSTIHAPEDRHTGQEFGPEFNGNCALTP